MGARDYKVDEEKEPEEEKCEYQPACICAGGLDVGGWVGEGVHLCTSNTPTTPTSGIVAAEALFASLTSDAASSSSSSSSSSTPTAALEVKEYETNLQVCTISCACVCVSVCETVKT